MSGLPELSLVLGKIASEVRRPNALASSFEDSDDDGASRVIASLTKSLNSADQTSSETRVLDSALSLMCLKTTEVCRARIECLVDTMISVLESSVSCKISRLGRDGPEFLQVGSSFSFVDCIELMIVVIDLLENLEANSSKGFAQSVLHTFLKTAVSSSIYQVPFSWPSICDRGTEITGISWRNAVSRLILLSSDEIYSSSSEIPLRLFFWYLNPLLLKNDISEVLQETMQRPFLLLKEEFYNRLAWRRLILCLVTSPSMFRQTTTLLHSWFLLTGVSFILELQIALVSEVLDVISRPMTWGVSMEMGLKYPFVHAYFPNSFQKLLGVLTGCISCNNFVDLVQCIKSAVTCSEESINPTKCYSSHGMFRQETILGSIDNNSTWSILMKFPTWFYFAAVLIFYYRNIQDLYISEVISSENNIDSTNEEELNKAAIFFLSFILSPVDKGHGDRLAEHLLRTSRSWSFAGRAISSHNEGSSSGVHNKGSLSWNKNLKLDNDYDDKHDLSADTCSFAAIASWLREFNSVCVKSWIQPFLSASDDSKCEENLSKMPKRLFNKIPIGILILYPEILTYKGCELLLYYATTGEVLHYEGNKIGVSDYFENEISFCYASDGRKWALDGVCLVFSIFDILEEISEMLFDCNTTRLDFICHLKGKVCKYLLKCVNMLLHLCIQQSVDIGGRFGLLDLLRRLILWKQLGREIFEGCEEFNDMVDNFANKFLTSKELQEKI